MTKKDYELFANAIWSRKELFNDTHSELHKIVINLCAEVFSQDNPSFNPDKFEEACYQGKHIRKTIKGGC